MSIQFRARIKSIADYTHHLSDTGVCCYPDGTQSPTEVSYISCMGMDGYFQYVQVSQGETPADVVCPNLSDIGCCCACEYVEDYDDYLANVSDNNNIPTYEGGLSDASKCDCDKVGGIWTPESCTSAFPEGSWETIFNFCTNGAYLFGTPDPVEHDRRFPEGCCINHESGSDVDGGPWQECKHVCSSQECSDFQNAAWPDCCPDIPEEVLCLECPHCCASHYPSVSCGYDPTIPEEDQIMCGDERSRAYNHGGNAFNHDEHSNVLIVPKDFNEKDIELRYKNTISNNKDTISNNKKAKNRQGVSSVCITTENMINYDCKIKSKNMCSGIWMGLNDAGLPFKCNDTEVTTIRDFLQTGTITKEVIDSWKLGEYHIAGYYAGIFNYSGEDGIHVSVEGFGNSKTGPAQPYTIQRNSNDIKEFKSFTKSQYAILIAPNDLETTKPSVLHRKRQKTKHQSKSNFDSVRNMIAPLDGFNKVNSYTHNSIGGWAIPSQHALSFIANQIKKPEFIENTTNNKAYKWTHMNGSYWSSSLLGDNIHVSMAYVHDFTQNFVSLCPLTFMRHNIRPCCFVKIN